MKHVLFSYGLREMGNDKKKKKSLRSCRCYGGIFVLGPLIYYVFLMIKRRRLFLRSAQGVEEAGMIVVFTNIVIVISRVFFSYLVMKSF